MDDRNEEIRKQKFLYLAKNLHVRYIKFIWVDMNNLIKSKLIRTKYLLENNYRYIALSNTSLNIRMYDGHLVAEAMESTDYGEIYLIPDWETFHVNSYLDNSVASVFGSFYTMTRVELKEENGHAVNGVNGTIKNKYKTVVEPWKCCPRNALKNAERMFSEIHLKDGTTGLTVMGSFEEEFYVLPKANENGEFPSEVVNPYTFSNNLCYDKNHTLLDDIAHNLELQGIPVESMLVESGPGQFEITIPYTSIMEACDRHMIFRETAHAIANKHGLEISFLPKPFTNQYGTGCHVHLSVWKDDINLIPEPSDELGISDLARRVIAGVLNHAKGLTALFNSNINSYSRLKPGTVSGNSIGWGICNKETMVRIPSSGCKYNNFEIKTIDNTANPYLAMAGVISAMADGLINDDLKLMQPISQDPHKLNEEQRKEIGIEELPSNFEQAVDELKKDHYLTNMIGDSICNMFIQICLSDYNMVKDQSDKEIIKKYSKLF